MTKRAIVAAAVAALGAGAAWLSGCAADDTRPPALDAGAGGEGGEGGATDDGGPPDAPADVAAPCGCVASGVCEPGDWIFLCGKGGEACKLCLTGAACLDGVCVAAPSACVETLKEEGLGEHCENDAQCSPDEWCATSCCDPKGAGCFAVWRCAQKRATGEPCELAGGGHECSSGVCDPAALECQ